MNGGANSMEPLCVFRDRFYGCLSQRAYALFELCDAILILNALIYGMNERGVSGVVRQCERLAAKALYFETTTKVIRISKRRIRYVS